MFSGVTEANKRQAKHVVNKKQAASLVNKKYPGKVLKIKDLKQHYKVRVLQPKGRVVDFTINKKNGKIKRGKK
jgi:uncharacterized membrane protein YkoI